MRTIGLAEAAAFLRLHPEELRRRAKAGAVPAAKPGKRWVFIEEDLAAYLRSNYSSPRQALWATQRKEMQCRSTNAVTRGGLMSPRRAAKELDVLLERLTEKPPRSTTTA